MRIDAHHHFWRYNDREFGWIDDSMSVIRRDFLPADLKPVIDAAGIDGVISVQARQSLDETRWLLEQSAHHDWIKAVVGWVPLAEPDVKETLGDLAYARHLKAVRHVVQDEPDDNFLLRDDFNRGIDALGEFWLTYDILIFERHLPQAIEFVDRHLYQRFVLDHLAKPRVRANEREPWATNIRRLAERENVYCKISGLPTEADFRSWTEEQLTPYLETVLEAFGPRRLMFGSDWPVCLLACDYRRWVDVVTRFCARLSPDEQAQVFGGTACEAYRLDPNEKCH